MDATSFFLCCVMFGAGIGGLIATGSLYWIVPPLIAVFIMANKM